MIRTFFGVCVRRRSSGEERLAEEAYRSTQAGDLAVILCAMGRFDEAETFADISERAAAAEDVYSQILWRRARALIAAYRGDLDGA